MLRKDVINVEKFVNTEEGYTIYIIPSGHRGMYISVYEDYLYDGPVVNYLSAESLNVFRKTVSRAAEEEYNDDLP